MNLKYKNVTAFCLTVILAAGLSACGESKKETSSSLPYVLNPTEYVLYQNIFYNETGDDYVGNTVTKTGTFAVLQDSYSQITRYYVWGYNDQTKCCDWQWEFVPSDPEKLPKSGSLIEMKGTFAASDSALDGYWYENASVKVKTEYEGPECDIDMTSMSDTLERVQLANVYNFASEYEGKTVYAYGRISTPSSIEDPYYDGSWQQDFSSEDTIPAIGTMVVASGVFHNGVIGECSISATEQF